MKKRNTFQIGKSRFVAINLTQPLHLKTTVYPGDPVPQRFVFSDIKKTGWQHFIHKTGDHNFQPHVDAPNHQNPDLLDKGVEIYGPKYEFNQALLIDLSNSPKSINVKGIKYLLKIDKEDLVSFSKKISQAGAILVRSGYDLWLEANRPHTPSKLPYFAEGAARFLASFDNLRVIGMDSLTVDPPGSHLAHQALKRKMVVESLVKLHAIPSNKRVSFTLQTSLIKIIGATGCPVVAYAFYAL